MRFPRNQAKKPSGRLEIEVLEDRTVLSTMGILSTTPLIANVFSQPLVANSAAPLASTSTPSAPIGIEAPAANASSGLLGLGSLLNNVLAIPTQTLGSVVNLLTPTAPGGTTGSQGINASTPGQPGAQDEISLNVGGILGLNVGTPPANAPATPSTPTVAVGPVAVTVGTVPATEVGPVQTGNGSSGGVAGTNLGSSSGTGTESSPTASTAASNSSTNATGTRSVFTANPTLLPNAIVNNPVPFGNFGSPLGTPQNGTPAFETLAGVLANGGLDPSLRADGVLPVDDGDDVPMLELENSLPQTSGILSEVAPFELANMERALQQFLTDLGDLRETMGGWMVAKPAIPLFVMGLAVTAMLHEVARRRAQKEKARFAGAHAGGSIDWFTLQ